MYGQQAEEEINAPTEIIRSIMTEEGAPGRELDGMVDMSGASGDTSDDLHYAAEAKFDKHERCFDISSDYCIIAIILDLQHKLDFFEDNSRSAEENKTERENGQCQAHESNFHTAQGCDQHCVRSISCLAGHLRRHDPLAWWKVNASDFPELACMARDYLAIQATSFASECGFSSAKHPTPVPRTRLTEKTVKAVFVSRLWRGAVCGKKCLKHVSLTGDVVQTNSLDASSLLKVVPVIMDID